MFVMYIYVYDEKIKQNKKFNKELIKVEGQLTEFGLPGIKIYLNKNNNPLKAIDKQVKSGIKTIIIIGDDETVNKTINYIAKIEFLNKELPVIGIIPISKKNNLIANAIGAKKRVGACRIILKRRIQKINLIQANNNFFLSQAYIHNFIGEIKTDKKYSINIDKKSDVYVLNFSLDAKIHKNVEITPNNKNIVMHINNRKIKRSQAQTSYFNLDFLSIGAHKNKIIIDNALKVQTPAEIKMSKKQINLIVGTDRNFFKS